MSETLRSTIPSVEFDDTYLVYLHTTRTSSLLDRIANTGMVSGPCESTCAILGDDGILKRKDTDRISNISLLRGFCYEPAVSLNIRNFSQTILSAERNQLCKCICRGNFYHICDTKIVYQRCAAFEREYADRFYDHMWPDTYRT